MFREHMTIDWPRRRKWHKVIESLRKCNNCYHWTIIDKDYVDGSTNSSKQKLNQHEKHCSQENSNANGWISQPTNNGEVQKHIYSYNEDSYTHTTASFYWIEAQTWNSPKKSNSLLVRAKILGIYVQYFRENWLCYMLHHSIFASRPKCSNSPSHCIDR